MESEIIKTDDPNIVIERTFYEVKIDIEAIKSKIKESYDLANEFKAKKDKLEKFLELSEDELVNKIVTEKIEEYQKLIDGFLMDKFRDENYLNILQTNGLDILATN